MSSTTYVAFDITPLQNGHRFRGIGTYVRGLAAGLLAQAEIPIEFWGWDAERPIEVRPPHRAIWLPRLIPRTRFPALVRWAMQARSVTSRAAAIHITDPRALIALPHRAVMTTVYDLIPMRQGISARPGWYRTYLDRLCSSSTLFAISQTTAEDLVTSLGVPEQSIVVAPPGVAIPAADGATKWHGRRPFFLFVGFADPNKNLDTLIEAMRLSPDIPEVLLITGAWPKSSVESLEATVRAVGELRGRVTHLGYVSRETLDSLYRSCTAVVVPSLIEGFGLPVAEAMAAGAAVAHSELPVLEEVSQGCALTFPATSSVNLAACLRKLSSDEQFRRGLQARGLQRAKSITWSIALGRTLAIYRNATESARRNSYS